MNSIVRSVKKISEYPGDHPISIEEFILSEKEEEQRKMFARLVDLMARMETLEDHHLHWVILGTDLQSNMYNPLVKVQEEVWE